MTATVIRNLMTNALKFTPSGGNIILSALQNGQSLDVIVSDTGVGISDEYLPYLFRIDMAYTNPGTNGEQGTGLGLILCKELAEKNYGNISVESEIGKGTTFTFTLPIRPVE
jgi:signal transduction histidine kinase